MIDFLGYFGPQLLFFLTLYLLYSKKTYLFVYIAAVFFSSILNFIIKAIVKQPRPKEDLDVFNPEKKHSPRIASDIYGMPSGHSQHVFLSTAYIYLVFRNINLTLCYFVFSLLTLVQRVRYRNHTFKQVIVGGFIGTFLAYVAYHYASTKLTGKINTKQDDNAREVTDGYSY
jgi:membrane-associated phospholipid phosphatase